MQPAAGLKERCVRLGNEFLVLMRQKIGLTKVQTCMNESDPSIYHARIINFFTIFLDRRKKMPETLEEVLDSLGPEHVQVNDHKLYDPEQKLVVYRDPDFPLNTTMDYLEIPEQFNVFTFLNISGNGNGAEAYGQQPGWRIALKANGTHFIKLGGVFEVSQQQPL